MFAPSLLVLAALSVSLSQLQVPPGARERSERLRLQVKRVCGSLNLSTEVTPDHLRNILVDDVRGILYCSAHKVASSVWKRSWIHLTSPSFNASSHVAASRNLLDKDLTEQRKLTSFIGGLARIEPAESEAYLVRGILTKMGVQVLATHPEVRYCLPEEEFGPAVCTPDQAKGIFDSGRALQQRHTIHLLTQPFMLVQPRFEDVWPDMLASYRKFLFVRHPLHRVVSAYRDKLEHPTEMEDFEISPFIKKIIYKKFGTPSAQTEERVSFPDFIKLISHQEEEESLPWDSHWRPIHEMCNPCGIDYDFIGKVENLYEDSNYVLKWLGVEEIVEKFSVSSKSTGATRLASRYLQGLDSSLRSSFLARYLLDYLSFDYELV